MQSVVGDSIANEHFLDAGLEGVDGLDVVGDIDIEACLVFFCLSFCCCCFFFRFFSFYLILLLSC